MSSLETFDRQLTNWEISISPDARAQLSRYARLLADYDKANVIGTRDVEEIMQRHVLDSLSCLLFASLSGAQRLADVGSGGGLPGIPLAIVLPNTTVTLFESVGKKVAFLRYAVEELSLNNAWVVDGRVEEIGRHASHRGSYDVCTVRAVARLSVIAEYCLPLLRPGGRVVAMKGRQDDDERAEGERAARIIGGRFDRVIPVPLLPEVEQRERHLILLQKTAPTPERYPRKVGTPARDPLGKKRTK